MSGVPRPRALSLVSSLFGAARSSQHGDTRASPSTPCTGFAPPAQAARTRAWPRRTVPCLATPDAVGETRRAFRAAPRLAELMGAPAATPTPKATANSRARSAAAPLTGKMGSSMRMQQLARRLSGAACAARPKLKKSRATATAWLPLLPLPGPQAPSATPSAHPARWWQRASCRAP